MFVVSATATLATLLLPFHSHLLQAMLRATTQQAPRRDTRCGM